MPIDKFCRFMYDEVREQRGGVGGEANSGVDARAGDGFPWDSMRGRKRFLL